MRFLFMGSSPLCVEKVKPASSNMDLITRIFSSKSSGSISQKRFCNDRAYSTYNSSESGKRYIIITNRYINVLRNVFILYLDFSRSFKS